MKGILMTPDMIQAVVERRKTNTRRAEAILKELNRNPDAWELLPGHEPDSLVFLFRSKELSEIVSAKPRYHVGETVYIKERALYWVSPVLEGVEYAKPSDWWTDCVYQDDAEIPALLADNGRLAMERSINQVVEGSPIIGKWVWKSSMFMPEDYARHFITILAVRAERLQGITESDAELEGLDPAQYNNPDAYADMPCRNQFIGPWDSLNPKYPWESNPFIFVYTFEMKLV